MRLIQISLLLAVTFQQGLCSEEVTIQKIRVDEDDVATIQGRDDHCSCECYAGRVDSIASEGSTGRMFKYRQTKQLKLLREDLLEGHLIHLKKFRQWSRQLRHLRRAAVKDEDTAICDCMCDSGVWVGEILPGLFESSENDQSLTSNNLGKDDGSYGNYGAYGNYRDNYGGQIGNYGQYGSYGQYGNYASQNGGNYGSNYGNQYWNYAT
jgi:hypothetical protein